MSVQSFFSRTVHCGGGFLRLGAASVLAASMLATSSPAGAEETTTVEDATSVTPLERVSSYVDPSVVRLDVQYTGWVWDRVAKEYLFDGDSITLSFSCTGYVVSSDGYIATAGHCVDPKSDDVAAAFEQAATQWQDQTDFYGQKYSAAELSELVDYAVDATERGRPDVEVTAQLSDSVAGNDTHTAHVVDYTSFSNGDAALVKIAASNLQALPLSDDDLGVGTEIVTVGYAGSVDNATGADQAASYKEGTISSEPTTGSGSAGSYEVSAALTSGMSGGPTVNLDGEVVGTNSFGISGENQAFNFIRPANAIAKLLHKAGADNTLTEVSQNYRLGLDAYFTGDKDTATTALQAVIAVQPNNTIASEFLTKANQLPDPVDTHTDTTTSPTPDDTMNTARMAPPTTNFIEDNIIALGAGALTLLLIGLTTALLHGRRTTTSHTPPHVATFPTYPTNPPHYPHHQPAMAGHTPHTPNFHQP